MGRVRGDPHVARRVRGGRVPLLGRPSTISNRRSARLCSPSGARRPGASGLSLVPMNLKDRVRRRIDAEASSLIDLSHTIHGHPELAYEEVRSSALLAAALEEGGLTVERSVYGLETAFRATAGHRGLHMVICAEYDALPEIGHACGHNIIGASSVGAGLALSEVADDLGIRVTV